MHIPLQTGKSITLTAKVYPAEAEQKVTWSIKEHDGCPSAKINASTGVLTAGKNDSGSVTVLASVPGIQPEEVEVTVPIS